MTHSLSLSPKDFQDYWEKRDVVHINVSQLTGFINTLIHQHGKLPHIDLFFVANDIPPEYLIFDFFDKTSMMKAILKIYECRFLPKSLTWNCWRTELVLRVDSFRGQSAFCVRLTGSLKRDRGKHYIVRYNDAATYSWAKNLSWEEMTLAKTQKVMPLWNYYNSFAIRANL